MSIHALEKQLLAVPDLPFLINRLQDLLNAEMPHRLEFRAWLTPEAKAEFINGSVVVHSPAAEDHNAVVLQLGSLAHFYATVQQLGKVRVEKALIGLTRNDYEPDVAFWRKEVADQFQPGMNVYPKPDLIVEVLSPGAENFRRDAELKKTDYAAHFIPEYWIVDPKQQTIEQYLLSQTNPGVYELHKKIGLTDLIESVALHGFAIPVRAVFDPEAHADAMRRFSSLG